MSKQKESDILDEKSKGILADEDIWNEDDGCNNNLTVDDNIDKDDIFGNICGYYERYTKDEKVTDTKDEKVIDTKSTKSIKNTNNVDNKKDINKHECKVKQNNNKKKNKNSKRI